MDLCFEYYILMLFLRLVKEIAKKKVEASKVILCIDIFN